MDWRNRKYYLVRLSIEEYEYRIRQLKLIQGIRIHNPTQLASTNTYNTSFKFKDEQEPRGYYHFLIGCKTDISELVEFELRKSQRSGSSWKEIKQKIKPYSPYQGFPERRCDLNPRKRCTHCGDC